MKLQILPGVVVEKTADTLLFLDSTSGEVTSVPDTGLTLKSTPSPHIIVTSTGNQSARALVDKGLAVAESVESRRMPSRRSVVAGGAFAVGAGLASLALPTVATASSVSLPLRTGEWDWEPQAGDPPSSYNIYIYITEVQAPEVDISTWSYDAGRWTVEIDLDGATHTGTEYDDPPPEWEWYVNGARAVSSGPGLAYLQAMDENDPYVLSAVLKENGVPIANYQLSFRPYVAGLNPNDA